MVVLAGVITVVGPGTRTRNGGARSVATGLAFALLAAFGQGAGVVLAKAGLAAAPVLPATLVRLVAGATGLALMAGFGGRLRALAMAARDRRTVTRLVPAAVIGTYLALLLMTAGIAYAPATIAAVLLATTPVFGLVVEAVVDHRRPTLPAVLGTVIAVAGVAILVNAQ
jgi:drug/metabolite transporter (DMT)-like permease